MPWSGMSSGEGLNAMNKDSNSENSIEIRTAIRCRGTIEIVPSVSEQLVGDAVVITLSPGPRDADLSLLDSISPHYQRQVHELAQTFGITRRETTGWMVLKNGYGGLPCQLCGEFDINAGLRFVHDHSSSNGVDFPVFPSLECVRRSQGSHPGANSQHVHPPGNRSLSIFGGTCF